MLRRSAVLAVVDVVAQRVNGIDGAGPVTPDNARCVRSCPHQRHGKAGPRAGEVVPTGDGQDHRCFGQSVKGRRGHHQDRPRPVLFRA